jgi:hypothetical protein
MDSAPTAPPETTASRSAFVVFALWAALVLYAVCVARFLGATAEPRRIPPGLDPAALVSYGDFAFVRWGRLSPENFARVTAAALARHAPVYALLFPCEVADALEKNAPGRWTRAGAVRQATVRPWPPTP